MKCKKYYKNMAKYKRYKRNSQRKNREKGRIGTYTHEWTEDEIYLILNSELTDREISKIIKHSVQAIQTKRHKIKKGEQNAR